MSDNVVDDFGWTSTEGPPYCSYISPRILTILKELDVKRVLDLGSGNGKLCSELANNGYEAVGVEYDKRGVEISRSNYPYIQFYNFGVQDDPAKLLEKAPLFDAVVSTEVVEHLFAPHMLPIYAHGVLKENGYLVITAPYHGYIKNLAISLLNKWDRHFNALWHGGHIKFLSRKTLSQLLQDNGFEVIAFSGVGRVPYLWKSMVIVAKKA